MERTGLRGKGSGNAELTGCQHFLLQWKWVPGCIKIGRAVPKAAVDLMLLDEFLIGFDGFQVGMGIFQGFFPAKGLKQMMVDQVVLAGDFGSGILCLSAADSVCL